MTNNNELTSAERAELENLRNESYLRKHHGIENEDAVSFCKYQAHQYAEAEGCSFNEAADRVLAENPDYRNFRRGQFKNEIPVMDFSTVDEPASALDRIYQAQTDKKRTFANQLFKNHNPSNGK